MHPKKCPSHLRLWWPCRVLSQIHSRRPPCWGEQDVPPDWRNKTTVMLRNLPNKCPGFFWERSSYHPPLTHLFPSEIRPCEGLVKGHQGLISFDKALGPGGRDVKGEGGWLAIKWNWTSLKCPGMFRHSFLWVKRGSVIRILVLRRYENPVIHWGRTLNWSSGQKKQVTWTTYLISVLKNFETFRSCAVFSFRSRLVIWGCVKVQPADAFGGTQYVWISRVMSWISLRWFFILSKANPSLCNKLTTTTLQYLDHRSGCKWLGSSQFISHSFRPFT